MTAQPASTFSRSSRPFGAPIGMSAPAAVSFQGVTKRYGPTTALDDVSLDLAIGSTVALLGPNGAGKSTAIHLFLGLLQPDAGDVRVLGVSAADAIDSWPRRGDAPDRRPADCASRPASSWSSRAASIRIRSRSTAILATAGLTALADRRVEGLSGGESQRLRFAIGDRRRSRSPVPRRTDRRDGRREPAGVLGRHARVRGSGSYRHLRDALSRRGRPASPTASSCSTTAESSPTEPPSSLKASVRSRSVRFTLDRR